MDSSPKHNHFSCFGSVNNTFLQSSTVQFARLLQNLSLASRFCRRYYRKFLISINNDSSEENGASHSQLLLIRPCLWECDNVVITLEYPDFSQLWNVDYTYEIHLNTKMQSEAKTFERITSDIVKLS